jgi:hypothetical protein
MKRVCHPPSVEEITLRSIAVALPAVAVKGIALRSVATHLPARDAHCQRVSSPAGFAGRDGFLWVGCFPGGPPYLAPALTPEADPGGSGLGIVSRFARFDRRCISSL